MLEKERDRLVNEIDSLQSRLDFISRRRNQSNLILSASLNAHRPLTARTLLFSTARDDINLQTQYLQEFSNILERAQESKSIA